MENARGTAVTRPHMSQWGSRAARQQPDSRPSARRLREKKRAKSAHGPVVRAMGSLNGEGGKRKEILAADGGRQQKGRADRGSIHDTGRRDAFRPNDPRRRMKGRGAARRGA